MKRLHPQRLKNMFYNRWCKRGQASVAPGDSPMRGRRRTRRRRSRGGDDNPVSEWSMHLSSQFSVQETSIREELSEEISQENDPVPRSLVVENFGSGVSELNADALPTHRQVLLPPIKSPPTRQRILLEW